MSRWYPCRGHWCAFVALFAMLRLLLACSCNDNEKHGSSGPEPPLITVPEDGAVTPSDRQEVSGSAEENANVEVFDGDESLGTVDAQDGRWETMATNLSEGEHVFTATATKNGKSSEPSEPVTLIVDRTDPKAPVIESPEDGRQGTLNHAFRCPQGRGQGA